MPENFKLDNEQQIEVYTIGKALNFTMRFGEFFSAYGIQQQQ